MSSPNPNILNDRDVEFLCGLIPYIDGGMSKADWKAVALSTGLKDAHIAQTKFGKIRKKLQLASNKAQSSTPKPTTKKATPSKPISDKDTGNDSEHVATASKRGTKRKAKEAFAFTPVSQDADDETDESDDGKNASGSEPVYQKVKVHGNDEESQDEEPVVELEA